MNTASTISGSPAPTGSYSVEVGRLCLRDGKAGRTLRYERDADLHMHTKPARQGEAAAVVLIELGIDGYDAHQARLDFGLIHDDESFRYRPGDDVRALSDAIETLTALRDELARCGTDPAKGRSDD